MHRTLHRVGVRGFLLFTFIVVTGGCEDDTRYNRAAGEGEGEGEGECSALSLADCQDDERCRVSDSQCSSPPDDGNSAPIGACDTNGDCAPTGFCRVQGTVRHGVCESIVGSCVVHDDCRSGYECLLYGEGDASGSDCVCEGEPCDCPVPYGGHCIPSDPTVRCAGEVDCAPGLVCDYSGLGADPYPCPCEGEPRCPCTGLPAPQGRCMLPPPAECGGQIECDAVPTACADGLELTVRNGCYDCVLPGTCQTPSESGMCDGSWRDETGICRAPNDGAYPQYCCNGAGVWETGHALDDCGPADGPALRIHLFEGPSTPPVCARQAPGGLATLQLYHWGTGLPSNPDESITLENLNTSLTRCSAVGSCQELELQYATLTSEGDEVRVVVEAIDAEGVYYFVETLALVCDVPAICG